MNTRISTKWANIVVACITIFTLQFVVAQQTVKISPVQVCKELSEFEYSFTVDYTADDDKPVVQAILTSPSTTFETNNISVRVESNIRINIGATKLEAYQFLIATQGIQTNAVAEYYRNLPFPAVTSLYYNVCLYKSMQIAEKLSKLGK